MPDRNNFMANSEIIENSTILENTGLRKMVLYTPEIAEPVKPGQLVHIKCGEALTLRRPFSIASADNETLTVCYDIRGKGTKWMAEQVPGAKISVLGPLGNGYTLYENKKALLVGGGTGIYSLLSLAAKYKGNATVALGFRSAGLINYVDDFKKYGSRVSVITDDKGFVTELVREELESNRYDIVYMCGPTPMMKNAFKIVNEYDIECEASMEEHMGCGVGACMACVCKTILGEYKRVCVDGPVFNAKEILWL